MKAPDRIWAAPPFDDPHWESGAGEWDISQNWAADHRAEYISRIAVDTMQARIEELEAKLAKAREALELADAALRGANMNMRVVEREVQAALSGMEPAK